MLDHPGWSGKSCKVFTSPPRIIFHHAFHCCIFAMVFLCLLCAFFGSSCLFLVMLRCWLIHPNLDLCLLLGRQNLTGTFDGRKDTPGAITYQLLISSKFPFVKNPFFFSFFILPNLNCTSMCPFEAGFYIPLQCPSITLCPR